MFCFWWKIRPNDNKQCSITQNSLSVAVFFNHLLLRNHYSYFLYILMESPKPLMSKYRFINISFKSPNLFFPHSSLISDKKKDAQLWTMIPYVRQGLVCYKTDLLSIENYIGSTKDASQRQLTILSYQNYTVYCLCIHDNSAKQWIYRSMIRASGPQLWEGEFDFQTGLCVVFLNKTLYFPLPQFSHL